jgi:hypothetical protein
VEPPIDPERFDAPELLAEVAEGVACVDGVRVKRHEITERSAAA